eukprot:gene2421-2456_t
MSSQVEFGRAASRAIFAVVLTAFFFGISDIFAQVQTRHLPPLQVAWLRYLSFVVFLVIWQRQNFVKALKTDMLRWQLARGVFTVASAISFVLCLPLLPIGDATAIAFSAPFIIMALSVPMLGEHVGLRHWLLAGVGLSGVLVIAQPGTSAFQWASLLPLCSALASSLGILSTRFMRREGQMSMLVYTALTGFAVLTALLPWNWVPLESIDIAPTLIVGVAAALANVTLIAAYRNVPVSVAAPFSYVQLVFAGLFGFVMSGVVPGFMTVLGAAMISIAGITGAVLERRATAS